MKREVALKLIEAVKAQKGPLLKSQLRKGDRYCVMGLLEEMGRKHYPKRLRWEHDVFGALTLGGPRQLVIKWSGITLNEATELIDANNNGKKADVLTLLQEMAK